MKNILIAVCFCLLAVQSGSAGTTNEMTTPLSPAPSAGERYGLFNGLDHRSEYGQGVFPEPFLVDDSDLEQNEARLDWLHTAGNGSKSDLVKAEVEHGFGLMTMELEVPYEHDTAPDGITHGFDNISLGARYPFYQFVSPNGFVDSTFGAGVEAGIPTQSPVSKNAELVPKIFNDLKVGNFTAQSILGYSTLFGPGDGGLQTFEYGFIFGYTVHHNQFPLPDVLETIPFFEMKGETEMNKTSPGFSSVRGNAGLRFNLKAIGGVQPRPGIGFVFPMNNNARQDTHWGIMTSFVFQF